MSGPRSSVPQVPLVIPEGAIIEVSMTIRLPRAATPEQLEEWLTLELGRCGSMGVDNPLSRDEPESWGYRKPAWRDTRFRGREIRSPMIKQPDGSEHGTIEFVEVPRP